jgi:LmbE family N-acetylglucosaminyl deacetylase
MRRSIIVALLVSGLGWWWWSGGAVGAQVQEVAPNRGAAAAWQALLRLRSTVTVLHTTAHPDDEDAALLTWLARGQGVRTGLLTLNRGEGGANLIGPELYDGLGVMRTEELLAADRYYGIDRQMFTRVVDFGFSKRLDETIEHWGRETVLDDVVHAIRLYRPDIVVSRFHGKARDGHGNHQAAGLLSAEALKLAADPTAFPAHFKAGLAPWRVRKFYQSVRGNEPSTLTIDVGQYDPLLGRSYREVAMEGYGLHRSQSVGQARPAAGTATTAVALVETSFPRSGAEQSLFEGLDGTLRGLAALAPGVGIEADLGQVEEAVTVAIERFDARRTWTIAPLLVAGARHTRRVIARVEAASLAAPAKDELLFRLRNKEREFNEALNLTLGLALEVVVEPDTPPRSSFMTPPRQTFAVAIPGQEFKLSATVVCRGTALPVSGRLELEAPAGWQVSTGTEAVALPGVNRPLRHNFTVRVADNAPATRPYWSRDSELRDHVYRLDRPEMRHLPFAPPELSGIYRYQIEDQTFTFSQPALTSFVKAPFGEQRRLVSVAPALNVAMTPRVGVAVPGQASSTNVVVTVSSNVKGPATGLVRLKLPEGWRAEPASHEFTAAHEGETSSFNFRVLMPNVAPGASYRIEAVATYAGRDYREGYQVISHRDLEPRHLYRAAVMEIKGVEVKVPAGLHVGYVMGVGDLIPEALQQIGVKVSLLGANDLAGGELDQYDTILIGIRASAVRPDLKAWNRRLLEYVERGGNLIWQYQTPEFDEIAYGPYPYKMGRNPEEVSEEESVVRILDPANPVFKAPNVITAADFDGWVEERGSKWWGEWDPRYKPLLECHDRGQAPQQGGMMQARYGKGTFTYAGYAFYRQLPAGVPGAYRLFVNLIGMKRTMGGAR